MPQPVPVHSMSYEGNRGDGLAIGQRLGAAIAPERGSSGLWTPVSIVPRPDGSKGLYPHLVLDRAKPGLIAVNSAGRRFVNEAVSYHDFVLAMFESHKTAPSIPACLICDAAFIKKYGLGVVYPGQSQPGKIRRRAAIWSAAARSTSWPARSRSMPRNCTRPSRATTALRETGVDIDFGKGETELNRFNGDAGHQPNPCIGPLATPPFYAVAVWPADIAVSTGLATDADARVLDTDGKPIPGLYACGNDMASVMGGQLSGPRHDARPGDRVRLSRRDARAAIPPF